MMLYDWVHRQKIIKIISIRKNEKTKLPGTFCLGRSVLAILISRTLLVLQRHSGEEKKAICKYAEWVGNHIYSAFEKWHHWMKNSSMAAPQGLMRQKLTILAQVAPYGTACAP